MAKGEEKINEIPIIIAGPCSAESEEQVYETAKAIFSLKKAKYFRAGLWKPRTRPGNFEGVGEKGIQWLKKVEKDFGLIPLTEVATANHVEILLKHNIRNMWIGARTCVNPFSVSEIANALSGEDVCIFVKNPVTPDLQLWIGSLERLMKAGVNKVFAIHRGFNIPNKAPYRNAPLWEIPIELKVNFPELPILCDASHIAGNREFIQDICQKALDLGFEGLMIETHINPSKALTDSKQQVTPEYLGKLLFSLNYSSISSDNPDFNNQLENLRRIIDEIDAQILDALAHRFEIVKKIGKYKKENNIAILQIKRWANIIETRLKYGQNLGLSGEFLSKILKLVHEESIEIQRKIKNEE